MNGLTQEIYEQIYNVFDGLESNSFETLGKPEVCMFEKPLIGVAAGDDPYYDFLKERIGEFQWSPGGGFCTKIWSGNRSFFSSCDLYDIPTNRKRQKICRIMRRFSHAITGWFHRGRSGNL